MAITDLQSVEIFVEGHCKDCGNLVIGVDADLYEKFIPENIISSQPMGDFYIWCLSDECVHHDGEIRNEAQDIASWVDRDKPVRDFGFV